MHDAPVAAELLAVLQLHLLTRCHIEVEYGNGWSTPGPAAALCAKVKARGLPCQVGQEYHGVPKEWGKQ